MPPVSYVLTRVRSDFGANVLQLVSETGLFDALVSAWKSNTIPGRTSCACWAARRSTRFAPLKMAGTMKCCCGHACGVAREGRYGVHGFHRGGTEPK